MGFAAAEEATAMRAHDATDDAADSTPEQEMRIIIDETRIEPDELPEEVTEDETFQLQASYPVVDHWLKYNAESKTLSEVYIVFFDGDNDVTPPKSPGAVRTVDRFEIAEEN